VVADVADRRLVADLLRREIERPAIREIPDDASFTAALSGPPPGVIIVGYHTGWTEGTDILRRARAVWPDCAVIMLTGQRTEALAAAALQEGLDDYVVTTAMRLVRLGHSVRAALARRDGRAELAQLERRFRDALEAMLEGVGVFDADDRLVAWNGEYERFFVPATGPLRIGQTHDELMRACVAYGMFPAAAGREEEWLAERRAMHRQAGGSQEWQIGDRWFSVREYPVADGGSVGLRYDITVLKQAEMALREAEARASDFARAASDWFWETGADHRFTWLGSGRDGDSGTIAARLGQRPWDFTGADADPAWNAHRADLEAHRPFRDFRFAFRTRGGHAHHMRISGVPRFAADGTFLGYRGTAADETEAVEVRQRAARAERIVGAVAESLPGVVFQREVRPDGSLGYSYLSEGAATYLGVPAAELTADPMLIRRLVHPDDLVSFDAYRGGHADERDWEDTEYRVILPDGQVRWLWTRSEADRRDDGTVVWNGIVLDITARKEIEGRLQHAQNHDTLTDLPNRALLEDRLAQAIPAARRGRATLAVAVLGLDRFRTVNERQGLAGGDEVLRQVAARLVAAVRPGDTVARLSGDRFGIMLTDVARREDTAIPLARLRAALVEPVAFDGLQHPVAATIGVAVWPDDGDGPEPLLRNAEAAMAAGKASGAGRTHFFSAALGEAVRGRAQMESEMRRAIEAGEFVVHYQPIVDGGAARTVGAEALVRWRHPERGLISPAEFIPLAEETGLIVDMGLLVLRAACCERRRWRADGRELKLSVNLSGRQLHEDDLGKHVAAVIAETEMDPKWLEFELTESVMLDQRDRALDFMRQQGNSGVRFAIDDFGIGYSSFGYLPTFPVDTIKIDRSFTSAMTRDRASATIVDAIIAMAHTLGKRVVAEGVETADQAAYLRAYRCDALQGYRFGKPMTAEDFATHLAGDC